MTGTLVHEALAKGDLGLAVAALSPGAVATAIGLWGTKQQQATYLPAFTGDSGVPAAALALTEPRVLFDPRTPSTRAVRDGAGFVLDGVKSLVPRGPDAELFVVGAVLDEKPVLFLVESGTEGVSIESEPSMGVRAASLSRLVLDDVRVEGVALLGEPDGSTYIEAVRLSRLAWCALAVGTAQAVLDYVTPYVKEREAFGEPIAHRQSVAFMVADMAIELQAMRLVTYKAASRVAQGQDAAREIALARKLCADKGMQIGLDGVQLLGGHGFVKEHPVERWYRDLRAVGVVEGGFLVALDACARRLLRTGRERCAASRPSPLTTQETMSINLETPKKFKPLVSQAHQVAMNMLRPISRTYDEAEHEYPKELDMLAAMIDGLSDSGQSQGAGASGVGGGPEKKDPAGTGTRNGANLASVLSIMEMCWGDVGLLLSMPRQGLGNSAIASVADAEQLERFKGVWAGMAITEPEIGSDSARIRTTARKDGDEYVINGEKIYVTSGDRADHIVVWASLDKDLGRAAIKSFVVAKGTPGMSVERLEHKLGIRASDTAAIRFEDCRVPAANLLGSPDVDTGSGQGFAGAMATFDNTRPLVAAMAVGCARASLDLTRELLERRRRRPRRRRPVLPPLGRVGEVPGDGSRLGRRLPAHAEGRLDGRQPTAELAGGLDGQGEGRTRRIRHHAVLRRAVRQPRLLRARPAGEVGPRLQDPGHLRGHPADPAADRGPPGAGPVQR